MVAVELAQRTVLLQGIAEVDPSSVKLYSLAESALYTHAGSRYLWFLGCEKQDISLASPDLLPQSRFHVPLEKRSAPAPTPGPTNAGAAGPPPATNVSSNKRLQQTQARVDEVVDIMRMNVDKVLERDQKLSELDNRADALQAGASQFETSAAKLKRKYWWKNCKMMIILGVVCAVILIIIISE
ncbi:neuronal synaptobrevin-like [Pterocles gutturalis]